MDKTFFLVLLAFIRLVKVDKGSVKLKTCSYDLARLFLGFFQLSREGGLHQPQGTQYDRLDSNGSTTLITLGLGSFNCQCRTTKPAALSFPSSSDLLRCLPIVSPASSIKGRRKAVLFTTAFSPSLPKPSV